MTQLLGDAPDGASVVPPDRMHAEMEKVLGSRVFHGTKLLSRLLRFIVDQSMAGNTGALKESVLGVEVFGRGPGFDPRMDPIVRVDARRLRAKLAEYYGTEGVGDPVSIALPKGHYAPVFSWRESDCLNTGVASVAGGEYSPRTGSVAVLPFVSLNADPESQYFTDGLTEDVITALAKITGLRVIGRSNTFCYEGKALDVRRVGRDLKVRHVVEGSVRRTGARVRVSARMLDTSDCFHLWSEVWELENTDTLAVQKEISAAIEDVTRRTFDRGGELKPSQA